MKKIEKLFVNWVDGMKISRDHFIAQELAVRDHVRDTLMMSVGDHHFGLLEPADVAVEDREARLVHCRAICRDGARIELLREHEQDITSDLSPVLKEDAEGRSFYLLAMLQPDQREGVGAFVDEPPRQPVVTPKVSLQLLPVEKLNAAALRSAMVPVARFTVLQGRPAVNADFVPPSCSIEGFEAPERVKKELANTVSLVVRNAGSVLAKLYSKPRGIQERFPNRCYEHWATRSQLGLAPLQSEIAIGMVRPFELVRAVIHLAYVMDGIWRSMPERAELMKHVEGIGNWASLIRTQQSTMDELMQLRYQQWDLGSSLLLCTRFLEQTRQAYAQLGELDRFEVLANLRDIAPRTAEEIAPPAPPPAPTKRTFWEKRN